jgi:hypothetical protein
MRLATKKSHKKAQESHRQVGSSMDKGRHYCIPFSSRLCFFVAKTYLQIVISFL